MSDALVQSHIHLAGSLGTSPENAPIYKWVSSTREEIIQFDAEVSRSLTGKPFAHVIKREGIPVLHFDYTYTLRLEGDADQGISGSNTVKDYIARLKGLAGKYLYLVDHFHPVDGSDHTPYVLPVLLSRIENIKDQHPLLKYFYVQIYLNDLTP